MKQQLYVHAYIHIHARATVLYVLARRSSAPIVHLYQPDFRNYIGVTRKPGTRDRYRNTHRKYQNGNNHNDRSIHDKANPQRIALSTLTISSAISGTKSAA